MKLCTKCVMPETKPGITFDKKGVCSACKNHEKKKKIDWEARFQVFDSTFSDIPNDINSRYDVLIPVSGGKDSITQVYYALKIGLSVLAVNVDYGVKAEIGKYNLSLIPKMGCDLITFTPDQDLHRDLMKHAFIQTGTPDAINHPLLYCYPLHLAEQLNIPFVLFGENPAFEYVGDSTFKPFQDIDERWYEKYIAYDVDFLKGYVLTNWQSSSPAYYFLPKNRKAKVLFMGDYVFWDSFQNYQIAKKYGFKTDGRRTGTYREYSGIDEEINFLHQWTKYCKFGFGRATDHACEDIRNGRMSRKDGLDKVLYYDGEEPPIFIIDSFCKHIGITFEQFTNVMKTKNKRIGE